MNSNVYESPRIGVGVHSDASNLSVEVVGRGHLRISSATTGAELSVHSMANGMWRVRHKLAWSGFGWEEGEREFTTDMLQRAFNLQLHPEGMFQVAGRFRRVGDHLTVPAWPGEVVDGVPCMSIHLTPEMQDYVRSLIESC